MKNSHRLIPTPRSLTTLKQGNRPVTTAKTLRIHTINCTDKRSRFAVQFIKQHLTKRTGLTTRTATTPTHADIVLRIDNTVAHEQGYTLQINADQPIQAAASTATGLLYAGATLLQLLTDANELPMVAIDDQPEFRYRGNNWLQRAEITGWSYARGDDLKTIEKRMLAKLDLAALHKVNCITFDGFNWDLDKYPGHTAFMRRMNQAAALRGIRLSFGGYGAYNDGPSFINRHRYPDGEPYPCMGYEEIWNRGAPGSRVQGTCLSNRTLTAMRAKRIAQFVKAVQPGIVYYHSLDTATIAESDGIWQFRCEKCRTRWPNEDVTAADGMAGAFAAFYSTIARAVERENPDCKLIVVSPGYTSYAESDAAWQRDCAYWVNVSRNVKPRNVVIGLREQFTGPRSTEPRFEQLQKRLDKDARGHKIANLYFFGGDIFYNSHPYLPTPILNNYFRGAEYILNGNGNGYQEPQQLLNAECMWNPTGSAFFKAPPIEPYENMVDHYHKLSASEVRPKATDDFLNLACSQLYGEKAGPLVAEVYRLQGQSKLGSPEFSRYENAVIWMPVCAYNLPNQRGFGHSGVVWQPQINAKQIRRLRAVYREVVTLNGKAHRLFTRAACLTDNEDLTCFAHTVALAKRYAQMLGDFVDLFLLAHRAVTTGRGLSQACQVMQRYRRKLTPFHRAMTKDLAEKTLPPDSESLTRRIAADEIRKHLAPIVQSLKTGTFGDQ